MRAAKGGAASGSDDESADDEAEYEGGDDLLSMLDANLAKTTGRAKQAPVSAAATAGDSDSEGEGVDLLAMVAKLDGKGSKGGPAAGNANTNRFWRTATGTVGGADSEYAVGAGSTVADRSAGGAVGHMAEASQGATASTDAASAVQQLSLASLMQGLARAGGGGVVLGGAQLEKQLSDLRAAGGPIAALAGSATQARAERKVAYGAASKDVSRWQAVVAANRAAPHVSFTHEARSALSGLTSKQTSAGLKDKFTPETDLEAEVSALLSAAGVEGEGAVAAAEANELTAADVTPAEAKKRTQQLAKLRALMFYDEQKKARANKIKSKAFRRVLKRKRLREAEAIANKLKEENPEQAALLEQDSAMARAEARISQRHRARSKWVKKALALGGTGVAAAAYKAELNEHLQRAQELQAKINARPTAEPGSAAQRDPDSDSDDSDDSEGADAAAADWELAAEGDEANGRRDMQDLRRAREKLAAELAEVEAEDGAAAAAGGAGAPLKGLAGMKFMQTAANSTRAAAAEALAAVEAELAREERRVARRAERGRSGDAAADDSSESEDDAVSSTPADPAAAGRRSFAGGARADDGGAGGVPTGDSSAAKRSAKALRRGGAAGLQVSQVAGTATSRASASGAITVPGVASAVAAGAAPARKSNYLESLAAANGEWLGRNGGRGGAADADASAGADVNPWMAAAGGDSGSDGEGGGDLWGAGDALTATLADSRRLSKRAGMAAGKSKKSSAAATAAASATGRAAVVDVQGALASLETRRGRQQKRPREGEADGPTQEDLVRRAFVTAATDDVSAELEAEKAAAVEAALPRAVREERDENAGWGSWTGLGAEVSNAAEESSKRKRRRGGARSGWLGPAGPAGPVDVHSRKANAMAEGLAARSDKGKKGVVLSQKRDRKLASHQAALVPFPFTSAEQYARSIRAPLGKEWNTAAAVEDATRPEVALRAGMIVPAIASTKVQKSGDDRLIGSTTTSVSGKRGNALAPGVAKIGKRAVRTRDSSGKKRGRS